MGLFTGMAFACEHNTAIIITLRTELFRELHNAIMSIR